MDYNDKTIRSTFSNVEDRFKLICSISGDDADRILDLQVITPDGSNVSGFFVVNGYVVQGDDPLNAGSFDSEADQSVQANTGTFVGSNNGDPFIQNSQLLTEADGSLQIQITNADGLPPHTYSLVAWIEGCSIQIFSFTLNDALPS